MFVILQGELKKRQRLQKRVFVFILHVACRFYRHAEEKMLQCSVSRNLTAGTCILEADCLTPPFTTEFPFGHLHKENVIVFIARRDIADNCRMVGRILCFNLQA